MVSVKKIITAYTSFFVKLISSYQLGLETCQFSFNQVKMFSRWCIEKDTGSNPVIGTFIICRFCHLACRFSPLYLFNQWFKCQFSFNWIKMFSKPCRERYRFKSCNWHQSRFILIELTP